MRDVFHKLEYVPAEEKNLHQFKGASLKEVIEYLEGKEAEKKPLVGKDELGLFDGFLGLLRAKGVRVSTPEWLQFIQVIDKKANANQLKELVSSNELLNKVRLFAQTTLVKNKADEAAFHEVFNEYFELAAKIYNRELPKEDEKYLEEFKEKDPFNSEVEPEIKDQLNIKEVAENLDLSDDKDHDGNENFHGGKKDQHNDILRKADLSKQGGGNKQEEQSGEGKIGVPSEGQGDKGKDGAGQGDKGKDGAGKGDKGKEGEGKGDKGKAGAGEGNVGEAGAGQGDKGKEGEGKGDKGKAGAGEGNIGEAGAGQGDKGEEGEGKGNKGKAGAGEGNMGEAGAGKGDKGNFSGMGKGSSGKETENQIGNSSKIPEAPRNNQQKMVEKGYLVGGGKGKSVYAERVYQDSIINEGEKINKEIIQEREKSVGRVDRRMRYEVRPDRASMGEVIRNIRRVILDVSEVKTKDVNLSGTVRNFARRDFRFDYQREREKQPEIVLLIDVGGPVDKWSPLVKELSEAMVEGLTKLEIYLFHNNLYGYAWKPDQKNLLSSRYAKENSLIDIKSIVKKRKKVIIYGDAEMSWSELEWDCWPPRGNTDRVKKFGMGGEECLNFINKKSDSVVWINPVFKKEWPDRDDSGTIEAISQIIHMHDLTVGGVEDAIKDLMKK